MSAVAVFFLLFLDLARILDGVCFLKKNYLGIPGFHSWQISPFKVNAMNVGDLGSIPSQPHLLR